MHAMSSDKLTLAVSAVQLHPLVKLLGRTAGGLQAAVRCE